MTRGWDRLFWGIEHYSAPNPRSDLDAKPKLIGESHIYHARYPGEPTRPMLFTTRKLALEWCKQQRERFKKYKGDGICEFWRWRPVRVRETVSVVT